MVFKGTDAFFALKECSIINTIISNFIPTPSSPRLHRLRPNGGRRQLEERTIQNFYSGSRPSTAKRPKVIYDLTFVVNTIFK
jgi:hypothetical protein